MRGVPDTSQGWRPDARAGFVPPHDVGRHRHTFADFNNVFGPTPYTPGVGTAAAHTNITVGNGTETAYYSRQGEWILLSYILAFGSSTSFNGGIGIGLPVPADPDGRGNATVWIRRLSGSDITQKDLDGSGILVDEVDGALVRFRPHVTFQSGMDRVHIRRNNVQDFAANLAEFLVWDTQTTDTDNMWSAVSPTQVFFRTPGWYTGQVFISLDPRSDYTRYQIGVIVNSTTWLSLSEWSSAASGISTSQFHTVPINGEFSQNDFIQVRIIQGNGAGATVNSRTGEVQPRLVLGRVGPSEVPAAINASHPWVWRTGDAFTCSVLYQVAPGY